MTKAVSSLYDPFAAEVFNREVYALKGLEYASNLEKELPDVITACSKNRPVMIFAKVPADRIETVSCLEASGFRVVETNLTLKKQLGMTEIPAATCEVDFAVPDDEEAVRALAGTQFRYSRFHLDPQVDNAMADRFKAQWAGNFFAGRRGDYMVVGRIDNRVVGFLQLLKSDDVLVIDLMAVDQSVRRRGLAEAMMAYAGLRVAGVRAMQVGTQVANTVALACYQKAGFLTVSSAYTLHYHSR